MKDIGSSIAFCLRGHTSNRDAIGTAITVEAGTLRQTKYLQAGSGFLAQHSKELFFGLGNPEGTIRAVYPLAKRVNSGIQRLAGKPPHRNRGGALLNCGQTLRCNSRGLYAGRPFAGGGTAAFTGRHLAHRTLESASVFPARSCRQHTGTSLIFTAASCCSTFGQHGAILPRSVGGY